MKRIAELTVLVIAILVARPSPATITGAPVYIREMTVAKHAALSDYYQITATQALYDASMLVFKANSSSPPCYSDNVTCIQFTLKGDLGVFGSISDDFDLISRPSQLDSVLTLSSWPYQVKVVSNISADAAGSPLPPEGVTRCGYRQTVMLRTASPTAWAHEFGHQSWLPHDADCTQMIMYESDVGGADLVRSDEVAPYQEVHDSRIENACGTSVSTGLVATAESGGVRLNWEETEPGSVVAYQLKRADNCWGPFSQVLEVASGDPTWTSDGHSYSGVDPTAVYQRMYYYQLVTSYEIASASVNAIGIVGYAPPPPTIISGTGQITANDATVTLSWTPSSGATGYRVFRSEFGGSPDCNSTPTYLGLASTASWVDSTARGDGVPLFYRVIAVNAFGESGPSNEVRVARTPVAVVIQTNVPGATLYDNGLPRVLGNGSVTLACSTFALSASRTLMVPTTQIVAGTKYCFDSWSDGGFRSHTVTVTSDTTITLNLVPSGSGRTNYEPGALVPPELTDCRNPHIFEGAASAPNGLTVYPGTTLRFQPVANLGLSVSKHLYATDATFETVDSSSTDDVGAWLGVRIVDPNFSTLALRRCTFRNAIVGVGINGGRISVAEVDSCAFANNNTDLALEYNTSTLPGKRLHVAGNWFTAQNGAFFTGAQVGGSAPEADVVSNTFAAGVNNSRLLRLSGGFTGYVNNNVLNMGNTGNIGVELASLGPHYPSVSCTGNLFQFATPQRTAMIAPAVSGHPFIAAYNNNWNQATAADIEQMILHYKDTSSRAEVLFEPFTPPSGSGGGGGGGCPFVLSKQRDGTFLLENSILGASELAATRGRFVQDSYPLQFARIDAGRVGLRIAEYEQETDYLDQIRLTAIVVPDGADVGVGPSGEVVVLRPIEGSIRAVAWSGRNKPFVSPVAPGQAYTGEPGDSLEFVVGGGLDPGPTISRRFNVLMIPKPQEAPSVRGGRIGVTVRVSTDEGNNWITLNPLVPRALWSNSIVPFEIPRSPDGSRIRVIWNTQHSLGWAGLAEVLEPVQRVDLPCRSAMHTGRGSVLSEIGLADGVSTELRPGEHVDLDFDASNAPANARFVLTATGRYVLGGSETARVPAVAYVEQNRPNPFNPFTEIGFGVPARAQVRIAIFDVSGRLVRILLDEEMQAGHHSATWDGTDARGRSVASGVYFYDVRVGTDKARKRMVLLR